jgi:hypothetical protein
MLRWRERPLEHFANSHDQAKWNGRFAGKLAGWINHLGYRVISINNYPYMSHRLIWKFWTGEEPPETIDHADGVRSNNAWGNLRPATPLEQQHNRSRQKNSASGYRGVVRQRQRYRAHIRANGERHIRLFDTPQEASAWYESMARELHGKFYRPP